MVPPRTLKKYIYISILRLDIDILWLDINILRTYIDILRLDIDILRLDIDILRLDIDIRRLDIDIMSLNIESAATSRGRRSGGLPLLLLRQPPIHQPNAQSKLIR